MQREWTDAMNDESFTITKIDFVTLQEVIIKIKDDASS